MPNSDAAPTEALSLPEMLRIMDVATALRQDRELVEQQLNIDDLKARLRERLLAGSGVTGEPVTPEEVDRAIDDYFSTQNTFREPPATLETMLAHAYVRRTSLAKWAGGIVAGLLTLWLLFLAPSAPFSPRGRASRQLAAATSAIRRERQTIQAIAQDPAAVEQADRLVREADTYSRQGDRGKLDAVRDQLGQLAGRLDQEYTVRVVSKPGAKSAVDRYFTDEDGRRSSGYYLIVEAVAPDGTPVPRLVHNSETGRDEQTALWAERVPKEVYDRLARDKRSDGILDENIYAVKRRGRLDDEVTMKGADGKPLERMGQITQW